MSVARSEPFAQVIDAADTLQPRLLNPAADADEAEILELVLGSVGRWASEALDDAVIDAEALISREILRDAAELGLFGLAVPESHGGAGLSMAAVARVVEALAAHDRSVATTVGLHGGLGLRGLLRFGSRAQHDRWLPDLATGDTIAAFAATEAGAGSHIAGLTTTATPAPDGTLTLDGEKVFVTNGGLASVFTVLARTPGLGAARKGCSLLLLDRDMPGISIGPEEHKLGIRGSSTTTVSFAGVHVTPDRVIGEPGAGLQELDDVLSWGRTLMSAGCLGTARTAVRATVDYVNERQQFGRPIARFDQVRRRVAHMNVDLRVMESLVRLTTALSDVGDGDIGWSSSVTKVMASESTWHIVDDAIQLHGGTGFIEETGLARLLRDCRITRIFEGANDVLRVHIAAGLSSSQAPELTGRVAAPLREAAQVYDTLSHSLTATVGRLRSRHRLRLIQRQLALAGIADAAMATWALMAHLLRLDAELGATTDSGRQSGLELEARFAAARLSQRATTALLAAERDDETDLVRGYSDWLYASA